MPDLDEHLRHELRRTIKPVDVNDISSKIDRRRVSRARVRKLQSVALTVIVLVGTVGGVALMSVAFRDRSTDPIAATPEPAAEDIGLGFPVCDIGTFVGNWSSKGSVVYLATKANDAGSCPVPGDSAPWVVGLDEDGDGTVDVDLGPLQCLAQCRFFAAPDIDHDGTQELVIAQGVNGSTGSIRIFSLITIGPPALVPWQMDGKDFEFAWDTSNEHRAGASCGTSDAGSPAFVVWDAERLGPGHYRERRVWYRMDGATLGEVRQARAETIEVPDDEPLLPRMDRFCGSTLNASWGGY